MRGQICGLIWIIYLFKKYYKKIAFLFLNYLDDTVPRVFIS